DERLAGAGTLRQAHDGAELDVPVDLDVDLGELALRLERGDPAAQITEGDGLARDGHGIGSGLEHATLYTTRGNDWPARPGLCALIAGHSASEDARERADDPAIHRFERSLSFRWMPGSSPGMTNGGIAERKGAGTDHAGRGFCRLRAASFTAAMISG